MANESPSPRNPLASGGSPPNSANGAALPATEINEDAKPANPQSVFVNSEPIREDQVRNAVNFLSHPKVRTSAVIYRRSFLEKKGLTKEEIDEAFRRVPDPLPSAQTIGTNQEGQELSTSSSQPRVVAQTPQSVPTGLGGGSPSIVTLVRSQFRWYHAVCAVGLLAASGAGTVIWIKKSMIPRLKYWIRKVVWEEKDCNGKLSLVEEAAAAVKAAAAAATEVAKTSQDMIISRSEEKAYMANFMNLLDLQVQEMRSMSNAIQILEGKTDNIRRTHLVEHGDYSAPITNLKQQHVNGKLEIDSRPSKPSPPTSTEPSVAPHPKSYMEIMEMIQRGERPPNIRDINDQPPNPNQQISKPRLAPRSKPWEGNGAKPVSRGFVSSVNGEGLEDIGGQNNGVQYQLDGESSVVPWWQKKAARITDEEAKPVPPVVQPIQRSWVPPQPPPIAMPEAAEAIRRPKPKKDTFADEQSVSQFQPAEPIDELQRVTKISESGGEAAMHSGGSETNGESLKASEIEEEYEQNRSIEEEMI
ncbi:Peroxisomal membrane protein PEX14 [Linum grandiflorum]